MARLGRDYAFDIREIKRLQEVGVKTLETAEETGRDQEAVYQGSMPVSTAFRQE